MSICVHCNTEIHSSMTIGHATVCPSCGESLKSCVNCRFYDEGAYHQCREAVEEEVIDKRRANFCPSFMINQKERGSSVQSSREDALKKLKALFGEE